jgi:hypothetical protein
MPPFLLITNGYTLASIKVAEDIFFITQTGLLAAIKTISVVLDASWIVQSMGQP